MSDRAIRICAVLFVAVCVVLLTACLFPTMFCPVAWSPDGGKLLYTTLAEHKGEDDAQCQIRLIDLKARTERVLVRARGMLDSPVFHHKGEGFAYVRFGEDERRTELHVARLDGTDNVTVELFARPEKLVSLLVAWMPDGDSLVYADNPPKGPSTIRIIHADKGQTKSIAIGTKRVLSPRPAPNGREILFLRGDEIDDDARPYDLCVTDLDGSVRVLVPNVLCGTTAGSFPAWSPDGKTIAYVTSRYDDDDPPDVWLVDADGRRRRRLIEQMWGSWCPSWSPDGREIAIGIAGDDEMMAIGVVRVADRSLRIIESRSPGMRLAPSWSPDGKRLACRHTVLRGSAGIEVADLRSPTPAFQPATPDQRVTSALIELENDKSAAAYRNLVAAARAAPTAPMFLEALEEAVEPLLALGETEDALEAVRLGSAIAQERGLQKLRDEFAALLPKALEAAGQTERSIAAYEALGDDESKTRAKQLREGLDILRAFRAKSATADRDLRMARHLLEKLSRPLDAASILERTIPQARDEGQRVAMIDVYSKAVRRIATRKLDPARLAGVFSKRPGGPTTEEKLIVTAALIERGGWDEAQRLLASVTPAKKEQKKANEVAQRLARHLSGTGNGQQMLDLAVSPIGQDILGTHSVSLAIARRLAAARRTDEAATLFAVGLGGQESIQAIARLVEALEQLSRSSVGNGMPQLAALWLLDIREEFAVYPDVIDGAERLLKEGKLPAPFDSEARKLLTDTSHSLASHYAKVGQISKALTTAERGLYYAPDKDVPRFKLLIARACRTQGRMQEAEAALREVIESNASADQRKAAQKMLDEMKRR